MIRPDRDRLALSVASPSPLASKIAWSDCPGMEAPPTPPELVDQFKLLFHVALVDDTQ
ncbi:MAG: hypothetical protein JKY52_09495 [Flavobacteriales bacterium]|nr:hypothetical protein [Flavobacteriales bacterium]